MKGAARRATQPPPPPEPAGQAKALFASAGEGRVRLVVPDVIVVECGFVLSRVLGLEAGQVARLLWSLSEAPGVEVERPELIHRALMLFEEGMGLVDAYLAAHALESAAGRENPEKRSALVASFDRDLDGIDGLTRIQILDHPLS